MSSCFNALSFVWLKSGERKVYFDCASIRRVDGDGVTPTGVKKSASYILVSEEETEESDGDCVRHKRAKTPKIVPSKEKLCIHLIV